MLKFLLNALNNREGEFGKSYFQDFKDMRYQSGKSFLAPTALFRSSAALYFPNITGRTLASPDIIATTALLDGRVSVVTYASSNWAQEQIKSYTSALEETQVPGYVADEDHLDALREGDKTRLRGTWQRVTLNVEENAFKSFLLKMSLGGVRKTVGREQWLRYLLVRKGLTDEWKQSVGIFNQRVGYVYLVDAFCRIRWAGCGVAKEDEKKAFIRGLQKLVEEEDVRRTTGNVKETA